MICLQALLIKRVVFYQNDFPCCYMKQYFPMKIVRLLLILLTFLTVINLPAQRRSCGSVAHMEALMKNPEYQKDFRARMAAMKKLAEQTTSESRLNCTNIITIPVAIHFQGTSSNDRACLENLVDQQIAILNADFQGSNADITKWTNDAASYFPNISNGETCVEFCIATKNHPTNFGLTEGQKAITINQTNGDRVNAWAGYLNIFVMEIGNNILGYSPLGGRGNGDGVVIAKFAFGGEGSCGDISTSSSLDRGRTLTHEVGHWFSLNHIWGDGGCNVDDGVSDTPNSNGPNYGCPTNGKTACSTVDMHMNYMDYTSDGCMYMFSAGQSTRMENYVNANLQSLINNATNVCGPTAAPTCEDGIQNGDEAGVDCGGSSCPACPEPTCEDGVQNGNETGIDCGGPCPACVDPPTCEDGIQNGDETGIDCGGPDCRTCPTDCNQNVIYVLILPDNYGSEITWKVTDASGNEVASGGPYQDFNTEVVGAELCLPTGCYDFTIYDAFSDGICCDYGVGQYAIVDVNENILIEGGRYGASETKTFAAGSEDCGENPPPPATCTPPIATTLEYFNNLTRVRVNWNPVPDADYYHVLYRKAGSSNWFRVGTRRTRKTLRNLSTGTDYEMRLRARCPDGWTEYGVTYGFTTLSGRLQTEQELIEYEAITFDRMYPNPATDELNLSYSLDLEGEVNIAVYNMLGQRVITQSLRQEEGRQKVQLNIADLQAGTFILQIQAEDQQIVKKFVKN